jgi:hypothetical protein
MAAQRALYSISQGTCTFASMEPREVQASRGRIPTPEPYCSHMFLRSSYRSNYLLRAGSRNANDNAH